MVGSGRKIRGSGEKLTRQKRGREKVSRSRPNLPSFFPLVFLFALAAYDLTCSLLSNRVEQATGYVKFLLISRVLETRKIDCTFSRGI